MLALAMKVLKIIFLLLLSSLSSIGQVNKLGNPIIRNFTPEENGGNEQNWSVVQDNRGVMYFGNIDNKGVLEYDGKTWRSIPIANNSYVLSLAKDDEGTIYVGAVGEFGYLTPDSQGNMHYVSLCSFKKDSLKFSNINQTIFYKGKILFCSTTYIFSWDKKHLKIIDCGAQSENAWFFTFLVNDHLYKGSYKKGLMEMYGDSVIPAPKGIFFKDKSIYFMLPNGLEQAIVGTDVGFFWYNQKNGDVSPFNDKSNLIGKILNESLPYYAMVQPNGNLSFDFPQSLHYNYLEIDKDKNPYEALNINIGLKDGSITSFYRSAENTSDPLWLTTWYGLSRAEIQSPFRRYGEESGFNGLILAVIRFNGTLYIGTSNGLFKQIEENGFIKFTPTSITKTVWSFEIFKNPETGKESLLVGSDGGIDEVNQKGQINSISEKFKNSITLIGLKIYQSRYNPSRVYIGGNSELAAFDYFRGEWINKDRFFKDDLRSKILSIAEDNKGNLWVGTFIDGIFKLSDNNTKIQSYKTESGLPTLKEIQIFDYNHNVYFGTNNKGLYRFDYSSNKFLPTGLPGDSTNLLDYGVYRMVKTSNGYLLACLKNTNFFELAEHNRSGKYTINDIPFKCLPDKFSDAVYNDNGIIWISSAKELYSYNPATKRNYQLPYNALVRKVISKEDTVLFNGTFYQKGIDNNYIVSLIQSPNQIHKLPYRFNTLGFEFSATFYEKEENTQFSYFLEGSDENWSLWNKKSDARYTNLREGKYTFKVKARNVYGTESTIGEYKFSIAPPWYRTILAWITYAILFIAFVWILVRWNTRRLIAEKEELEKIVKERTAEVVRQKDEIEVQSEKISIQNEEIKSSIHYASRIQGAILTPSEQIEKIFNEYFILYLPRDIVSGDFYWITKVGTKKICVVADCTGHGVPGGFMSMLGMSFISQIIGKGGSLHPGDILNQLRSSVINSLHQTGEVGGSKDGMDIAIYVIDEETNILEFAGANNPLIHIRDNELNHIKSDKMPIGIHLRANEPFTTHTIELKPGDCVYTFSDGYADQFGGPDQRKFMIKNLKDLLLEIHNLPMAEQREKLHKTLLDWHGSSPRIDDVVVMGVRV